MMSEAKKRVPKRRFKEFLNAGDWEQRKLDDIAKIKTGGGTPKTAKPEYWSGNIPWIQSSDLVEGDITHVNINKFINNNALKNSAAKLISRDSIALVTRVGVGKVAVINQDFTTSQDFLSLSDFDRSDIKFLAYQLYRLMQENAKVLQGTSIKGITKTELIEQSISIPSSGQEQNLISNVLSKIDSFITLHQCKLDKLQAIKKALLQEMFPEEGQDKPKRRFKGFTDAWEQRKLSEVVTINPKTELPDEFKYVDLESVVGTNLLGFQVIKKENAPSRAQRLASYGDVFYQTVRPYQRNNYLFENIDKDMVFSTGYAQLRSKLDSYFLLTLVQNDNFVKVVLDNCTGTSYPAINGSELGKITVQIPSSEVEANQIGKVFRGIDKSITLHQRKLDKLKNLKQAYLNEMFV